MKILNKKAKFNYKLYDKFEAGVVLTGSEVKAVKGGKVDLTNSFVKIIGGEAFLINANIAVNGKDATKTRKLLLHKGELISIKTKIKAKKLTLIPTKLYTRRRLIKLEVALAKTKRKFEKRQAIKRKDIEREIERELKGS